MEPSTVRVDRIAARRIGFTSDTHCKAEDASDFPAEALAAFRDVDLIVHCGHYGNVAVLDRLGTVAPVFGLMTALDERMSAAQLAGPYADRVAGETRVIEAGGVRIGVIFDLSGKGFAIKPDDPPIELNGVPLVNVLTEKFGGPVDVVVYANTHIDRVSLLQGVLLVNPGSPNLPNGPRQGGLGSVAILTVADGLTTVEIVDLARMPAPVA